MVLGVWGLTARGGGGGGGLWAERVWAGGVRGQVRGGAGPIKNIKTYSMASIRIMYGSEGTIYIYIYREV